MREILFKAKAINRDGGFRRTSYKNGDWVYGLVTRLYDDRFPKLPAEMANTNGVIGIEIDYKTISQFTGLTDKNGKKIFEGDILKTHYANARKCEFVEVVVFHNGRFCAEGNIGSNGRSWANLWDGVHHIPQDKTVYMDSMEVIGNIHDNPELLEVNDNA